jgi:hypothetical protein
VLIGSVWLAGNAEISELKRDRDFRFAAVDSVGHDGPFKNFWTRPPLGSDTHPNIYMSDFDKMGVDFG